MPEILQTPDEALIKFERHESLTDIENHDKFIESIKGKTRFITVEPILLMNVLIMYLQNSVMNQYVYYRVGKDYNITTNSTLAFVCQPNSNSSAEKEKTDLIQALNSNYLMKIQMSSSVCTILTAPFYCVFSDRFGRRILFILPGIGLFVKSLFELLIQIFNWPINTFAITEGLYGLCGGFNFAMGLSYSYIADISTQKSRTKRMAVMGLIVAIGALCISLVTGFWIQYSGYFTPYLFSSVVSVLCVLYPIFLLKEPQRFKDSKTETLTLCQELKRLVTIYFNYEKTKCALLITLVTLFNFYYIAEMSGFSLISTYLMSYPICMNSIQMSYYSIIYLLSINIGVGLTVVLFSKWIPDLWLILFCVGSGIVFSLQMAFAVNQIGVYIAAATNLFSFSAFPFLRGFLSKKMSPTEQGALFGGLTLSETVCSAITRVVVIYFYRETFHIFHGLVYIFIGSFSMVAVNLTIAAIFLNGKLNFLEKRLDRSISGSVQRD